jgi:putative ABC transport system ATP-binding protein
MLSLRNLSKRFANGGETLPLFEGLDLALTPGETCLLLGQSGCGKSTLGRTLIRLYEPTAGEIQIEGKDFLNIKGEDLRQKRKNIQNID